MSMKNLPLPEWERVLSSAARLQELLPGAVLVGGTASSIHVHHRRSRDADHVLVDLIPRFDEVLAQLESVAGWKTARVRRPVQILGSLDGIETGVRQLIREKPLETVQVSAGGQIIVVPTHEEILRIKAVLILKRNATRDYIDFSALADAMGDEGLWSALKSFDELYEQTAGDSPLQQLQIQLSNPLPFDLEETNLSEYKDLDERWANWGALAEVCKRAARVVFAGLAAARRERMGGA